MKLEMDYQAARRHANNMDETNKRMKETLKDYLHQVQVYRVQTEELIKQIDLADAKTREKEDELSLLQAEYEKKLQLQEERILMRRTKDESRELYELKRNHDIELLEIKNKIDDKDEENEYFKKKIERLETDNQQLRVGKGDSKKMRELENKVHTLEAQLREAGKGGGASSMPAQSSNMDLRNVKKTLT